MYNKDAAVDIPIPNPTKDLLVRKIHGPLVVDAIIESIKWNTVEDIMVILQPKLFAIRAPKTHLSKPIHLGLKLHNDT